MMTQHGRVGQREAWGCEEAPTHLILGKQGGLLRGGGFYAWTGISSVEEVGSEKEASSVCPGESGVGISFRQVKVSCGEVRADTNSGLGRQSWGSCQEANITLV